MTMQIIIPMSGFGERFRQAGYTVPKPLINIEGKPIIAHVIDMFPGETDFIFICNQDHLDDQGFQMKSILQHYCPTGKIIGIPSHKLGPIYAVLQAVNEIDLDSPCVVNYCDFTCYWDWNHFKRFVSETACDGSIPAYKGFHPHSLGSTNYAYMREKDGVVLDIQEKQPYTSNRMEEYASSGTYYFSSGKTMLDALKNTMDRNLNVNNEYYVSLAYKGLLEQNKKITVYPLQHFMQWGTPDDVMEYNSWSSAFKKLIEQEHSNDIAAQGAVIIPMAGLGQRFADEGYSLTKPLISVSGLPMVTQAVHDLPESLLQCFILRSDMPGYQDISEHLKSIYPNSEINTVPNVTEGQACTAFIGLQALENIGEVPSPITFGACDNGVLYNSKELQSLIDNDEIDIIVWAVRGNANAIRNPKMFGWIDEVNGKINKVSVKTPLSSPKTDPIVIGTFTFRSSSDFNRIYDDLISKDSRINGEFYLDTMINNAIELGFKCHVFEVDSYLSWGTPNDLRTFEYWQSCFHKWNSHPYRLELDKRVPESAVKDLDAKYQKLVPNINI